MWYRSIDGDSRLVKTEAEAAELNPKVWFRHIFEAQAAHAERKAKLENSEVKVEVKVEEVSKPAKGAKATVVKELGTSDENPNP